MNTGIDQGALLNTLLHELKDGVIVCDPDAKIRLFNQAAETLFDQNPPLCHGNSLYSFCLQGPVEHALNLLQYQEQESNGHDVCSPYIQFMNAAVGQEKFFRCRLSFLPSQPSGKSSFVIILEDVNSWYKPDNLLFMKIEEFRAPMTNLRAAVESLTEHHEMSPVMRSAFENVLVQESLNLIETFESLARSCNVLMQAQSHLATLDAGMLFGYVADHMRCRKIAVTSSSKQSVGINADSYGLLLVLDFLADKILRDKEKSGLSCETHIGEQFIYFDFIWSGKFIPTTEVEKILEEKIEGSIGNLTVSGILHSMEGDLWSQQQDKTRSTLRLALPIATK